GGGCGWWVGFLRLSSSFFRFLPPLPPAPPPPPGPLAERGVEVVARRDLGEPAAEAGQIGLVLLDPTKLARPRARSDSNSARKLGTRPSKSSCSLSAAC
ncbi:MAG: hypothetical protein ACR2JO_04955, partial [Mycobacteriales bacterium]